ncbi:MAG: hypothetical protein WCA79_07115 [Anaerolineales bacterium]
MTEAWMNRNQEEYRDIDDNYDIELLSFLIDNFLLGKNKSFPIPSNLPKNLTSGVSGSAHPEAKTSKILLTQISNYIQHIFRRKF